MPPDILNFGTGGSADSREGKPVKITGTWLSGMQSGAPLYLSHVFVFHVIIIIYLSYRLTLSDKAQVSLQLRVSPPDLV